VGQQAKARSSERPSAARGTPYAGGAVGRRAPRWAPLISFPLSIIGLGLSIYLTYEHFSGSNSLAGCPQGPTENCLKVTTSSQSEIFGHIPVSLTGLIYFVALVALCTPWAWRIANDWITWLRLAAVISGVGMVAYLVFVETAQLKAICLYCTGVHITTFLLFLTVLAAYLLPPLDPIES
jgi:uncharacterized membrane protein